MPTSWLLRVSSPDAPLSVLIIPSQCPALIPNLSVPSLSLSGSHPCSSQTWDGTSVQWSWEEGPSCPSLATSGWRVSPGLRGHGIPRGQRVLGDPGCLPGTYTLRVSEILGNQEAGVHKLLRLYVLGRKTSWGFVGYPGASHGWGRTFWDQIRSQRRALILSPIFRGLASSLVKWDEKSDILE